MIRKEDLKHLEELAKIEIPINQEEKILADLQKIIDYFEELKEVNTEKVEPLSGGTFSFNVFQEDEPRENDLEKDSNQLKTQFPQKEKDFLKIPKVFE